MGDLATVDQAQANQLAAILGASQEQSSGGASSNRLPMLKISSDEDAQGREIKPGQFYVQGTGEEPIYAKTVKIRPLSQLFQYIQYDPKENKVANKTLMIASFKQEARDMKGTLRCGKPTSKVFREMTEDQQAKYRDITCFREIRALVSLEGTTADGEKGTIENMPVIIMAKGANFNGFEDEYVKALPQGKNLYEYWADVTVEKKRKGTVNYYVWHYAPLLSDAVPLDQKTLDTMIHMAKMIEDENKMIENAYQKSMREQFIDEEALEALEADLDADLEDAA
jgi:hypothetical protein